MQSKYSRTKEYDIPLYKNPTCIEELFSVKSIDETGIFELNQGMYSKLFILSDINFAGVTDSEQKNIIINLSRVWNSMPCRFSYSVANEYVDQTEFDSRVLYKLRDDKLDTLRNAYNDVIKDKLTDAKQGLYQTIYLTLTIKSDSMRSARSTFSSIESALRSEFVQIGVNGMSGSQIMPVDINTRMQLWYNFTHAGMRTHYRFDFFKEISARHDWINIVTPSNIVFYNDYFVMNGNRYGKVMYISDYPKSLESNLLSELSDINCTSYITVNSEILDTTALKKEIERKYAAIGMKIENEKQRNRNNNDFLTDASDRLLSEKDELVELSKQLKEGDDHYSNTTILIMFLAKSMEELAQITDKINTVAGVQSLEVAPCFNMQREGINSTFPFGIQEYKRVCNFSSSCLAMFMPYKTQELNHENGTYYGINQLSQNAIFANRKTLRNYNGIILGQSGSGKSVFAKSEIVSTAINEPNDQIIVIDPQNEYKDLAGAVNGSVISFDSQKDVYVNPLDVNFQGVDYATLQEIIAEKTDFILTLLSSCMRRDLDSAEQGILDKAIEQVYSENYSMRKKLNGDVPDESEYSVPNYMRTDEFVVPIENVMSNEEQIRAYSPTLQDIYQKLVDEDSPISHKIAAHMQIFVNGSLNLFNHRTNVDIYKDFLVFDISGIKGNLRVPAMLVMLELVRSMLKENFELGIGKWTRIYIDEFHELLDVGAVADFVIKLWKEVRKNHGMLTGITQNMSDLVNHSASSDKLTTILSNTEYFSLLSQSAIDRNLLQKFLPTISPAMFNFVEETESGTGLLKMGAITVPFDMRMSENSQLYKLINTDGNAKKEDIENEI